MTQASNESDYRKVMTEFVEKKLIGRLHETVDKLVEFEDSQAASFLLQWVTLVSADCSIGSASVPGAEPMNSSGLPRISSMHLKTPARLPMMRVRRGITVRYVVG